ncbi:MAG TPA: orotate phosphoribosyltransferase, partial [Alphaproteobacteria bacterium]|nr:orotate phosphoribosyltransferase [Alphaproteobacteria bacterium]
MAHPPSDIADKTARILFDIGAVHFNAEKPFIFTSGWASPVYVDCRKIISFVEARRALMDFAAQKLNATGATFDVIAGGETAGIPFAAFLSEKMNLPMAYVRKVAKGFGRMAQIEGDLHEGAEALLVEDLATDGKSKIKFCEALRKAGAKISHAFVVFHYGIFPQSEESMKKLGITLHSLCTWWDALRVARNDKWC